MHLDLLKKLMKRNKIKLIKSANINIRTLLKL